jgi:tetratricopeptide (TPR) repeat protein
MALFVPSEPRELSEHEIKISEILHELNDRGFPPDLLAKIDKATDEVRTSKEDRMTVFRKATAAYDAGNNTEAMVKFLKYRTLTRKTETDSELDPIAANMYYELGTTYFLSDIPEKANDYWRRSLSIYCKTVGDKHNVVAKLYIKLISVTKDLDDIVKYYTKASEVNKTTTGSGTLEMANAYYTYASCAIAADWSKKSADASKKLMKDLIHCYEKSLAIRLEHLKADDEDITLTYMLGTRLHKETENYDACIPCYEALINQLSSPMVWETKLGIMIDLGNVCGAAYYCDQLRYDELLDKSIYFLNDALKLIDVNSGKSYLKARVLVSLSMAYDAKAKTKVWDGEEEIITTTRSALDILKKQPNPEINPGLLEVYCVRASTFMRKELHKEGKQCIKKALGIAIAIHGELHIKVAEVYALYAMILTQEGANVSKAKAMYEKSMVIHETELGKGDPKTMSIVVAYCDVLCSVGMLDDALEYLQSTLEGQQRVLGPEHTDVAVTYYTVGKVYEETGNKSIKASEAYNYALDILTKKRATDNKNLLLIQTTVKVFMGLSRVNVHTKNYASAMKWAHKAIDLASKKIGEKSTEAEAAKDIITTKIIPQFLNSEDGTVIQHNFEKLSGQKSDVWEERKFVLDKGFLHYHSTGVLAMKKGTIELAKCKLLDSEPGHIFLDNGGGRVYKIRRIGSTDAENAMLDLWITVIASKVIPDEKRGKSWYNPF